MSGGKGGSQTQKVEIPEWLQGPVVENLARAKDVSQIGYTPYYGPDVAAFTPMQEAAFQNTGQAAGAFGMAGSGAGTGMPAPQTFAGGVRGYSSAPMYEQSLEQLQANAPGQYEAIRRLFVDPAGGGMAASYGSSPAPAAAPAAVLPEVTDYERRMGLTPEMKLRGHTVADFMGR